MSRLTLEPLEPADFETLVRWTTSAPFLMQWAGPAFSYPLTVKQIQEHHQRCLSDPPFRIMLKAVDSPGGEMVGHAELNAIDWTERSATVSRVIIGEPSRRGQGLGTELMELLLQRAFRELGLTSLELSVFDFNRRALGCYTRLGFRVEAKMENVRRVGDEFWTLYRMVLDADSWPRRRANPQV